MIDQARILLQVLLCVCGLTLSGSVHSAIVTAIDPCRIVGEGGAICDVSSQRTTSLEYTADSAVAKQSPSLVRIPSKMDNLYRYNVNSQSDIVTYWNKSRNTLQQALTFYNADRHLAIMVRDFPSGRWSSPVDIHQHIGNDELEYDSHNSTGLGIASDGTMFATANQHVDPLRMAMTTRPYDMTSFQRLPVSAINAKDDDRVTYPSFAYLGDELFFSYREQEVGGGKPAFRWLLKKWNTLERRWDDAAQFNTGTSLRLYVSNIAWNNAGTELHLAAIWRDDRPEVLSRSTEQQHDLFHLYSSDGRNWKQYAAGNVQLPLLWTGPGKSNVPELIWNTGKGGPIPANSGSIAVDIDSSPHILNKARDSGLFYHFHDGRQWHSIEDVFPSESHDIFQLPDGMGAISSRGDGIYFHRLSPRIDRKGILLAKGYTNKNFVASVDKTAIARGWLSMMLTENGHSGVNRKRGSYPTDAFVMSIPLARLDSFDTPFMHP